MTDKVIKVITVIQPWATLIALGEKRFETRSWAPKKHRGDLGIHAGKKVDKAICEQEPFKSVLAEHGYTADNLPTGAIVAITNLSECLAIHKDHSGDSVLLSPDGAPVWWIGQDSNEFAFGWYDDGRYAWKLEEVKRIDPIPAKGQLGMWNYPLEGVKQ